MNGANDDKEEYNKETSLFLLYLWFNIQNNGVYNGDAKKLLRSVCLFVCLNACFTSDHQTLQSIQVKVRHCRGALIMPSIDYKEKSEQCNMSDTETNLNETQNQA